MRIISFFKGLKYKFEYSKAKLESKTLCGIPLRLLPSTLRETPDQDDRWFFELAKRHTAIYDIGANVGYTALLALIQNPSMRYILVDPNPNALKGAFTNLLSNNLGFNAHYYCAFVSDSNDEAIDFYTIGSGQAGSMYPEHAKSAASIGAYTPVKTVTLDALYDYYRFNPDLVKIDVEGAETHVLKGASRLAKATQCTFFVEMHSLEQLSMATAGQFVLDWANVHHYHVWYLKEGIKMESAELIKDRGKCHLLLIPKEKQYPEYLIGIQQNAPLPNSLY